MTKPDHALQIHIQSLPISASVNTFNRVDAIPIILPL